jgi:hypothetical protein
VASRVTRRAQHEQVGLPKAAGAQAQPKRRKEDLPADALRESNERQEEVGNDRLMRSARLKKDAIGYIG